MTPYAQSTIILLSALLSGLPATGNSADKTSIDASLSYLSGDYGASQSTDIWYLPITLKHRSGPWTLKFTVPYVRITGPGGVVPELGAIGPTTGTRTTESGLGDMIAAATWRAYHDTDSGVLVDLSAKVKLPTADDKAGLGTGEADYYGQLDIYQVRGDWLPFAGLGYKVIGDTATTDFRNVLYASAGLSYTFNDRTSGGARLYARQKTTASNDPRQEVMLFASHKLHKPWKLQGYVLKGFSNASADWGMGGGFDYSF